LKNTPHDYRSIADAVLNTKTETITNGCTNSHRILNTRLSRIILYGREKQDLIDRCTVLQRCIVEMSRIREDHESESGEFSFYQNSCL
jgi:hypothetical protein